MIRQVGWYMPGIDDIDFLISYVTVTLYRIGDRDPYYPALQKVLAELKELKETRPS